MDRLVIILRAAARRAAKPRRTAGSAEPSKPEADDLACQELVELVTDYLEIRLPECTRARFETHLAHCSGCRAYLEQMRQTIRALGRLPTHTLQPEARDRLLQLFRDAQQRSR